MSTMTPHTVAHRTHVRDGRQSLYCPGCLTWPPPGDVVVIPRAIADMVLTDVIYAAGSDFSAAKYPAADALRSLLVDPDA